MSRSPADEKMSLTSSSVSSRVLANIAFQMLQLHALRAPMQAERGKQVKLGREVMQMTVGQQQDLSVAGFLSVFL